jgi:hypothetical protein
MISAKWIRTLILLVLAAGLASAQGGATVTLVSSQNPSAYGDTVRFTATYLNANNIPGAGFLVIFNDGGLVMGSGYTNLSGQATLDVSHLTLGFHAINASVVDFSGTTSSTLFQDVIARQPQVTLTSSQNPSTTCTPTTFTATIIGATGISAPVGSPAPAGVTGFTGPTGFSGATGYTGSLTPVTPTGNVVFSDNQVSYPAVTVVPGATPGTATATLTTILNPQGTPNHTILAQYSGDTFPIVTEPPPPHYTAASTSIPQTENLAPTTISLFSNPNPSDLNQFVDVTATVLSCYSGPVTGTVTFFDGSTQIGQASLSSGSATIRVAFSTPCTHLLTAVYSGDSFNSGTSGPSPPYPHVVRTPATLTVSANPEPSVVFAQANVIANIGLQACPAGGGPPTSLPAGTVQFFDNGTSLGTANVGTNGQATLPATFRTVGDHTLTATFTPSESGLTATSSGKPDYVHHVIKIGTSTSLAPTAVTITFGQDATVTATVTSPNAPSGAPAKTGTVTFTVDGVAQTPPVALSSAGTASFTLKTPAPSQTPHTITAAYSGDQYYDTSTSNTSTVTVNRAPTSTALSASVSGNSLTLTATVTSSAASVAGSTATVTFFDNGAQVGSASLANGTATIKINANPGSHSLTASFAGDNSFLPSTSPAVPVNVRNPATSISAQGNPSNAVFGQVVALTALVSPANATGGVDFTEGGTTLGSAALNAGVASTTVSNLSIGTHTITASYGGDSNFTGSSTTFTVTVSKAPTTTTISAPSSALPGQQVTLTARVGPFTATGTVIFTADGSEVGRGNLSNGTATATTSFANPGNHTVTAAYQGDANYNASTSGPATIAVGLPPSSTSLSASPTVAEFGQDVVVTATVGPAGATGNVTITGDGAARTVAAGGSTTYTGLSIGTHTFTAHYEGNANFAPSDSNSVTVTVNKGSTRTSISQPSPNPATVGQTVTVTATVSPTFGAGPVTGSVIFTVDGTAGQPVNLSSSGTATFTASNLAEGSHSISAAYSGDNTYVGSASGAVTVTVNNIQPPTITAPASLPPGQVGVNYQQQTFTATGGTQPYTWSLVQPTTTNDLQIDATTGVLTGKPTSSGNFQVTVQVKDSSNPALTSTKTYSVSFAFPPLPAISLSTTQLTLPGYPLPLKGTLQLTFTPNASNLTSSFVNQQLRFATATTPDGKTTEVDIPAGSSGPIPIPPIQQGSVAGTITVSLTGVTFNGNPVTPFQAPPPATIVIAQGPPTIVGTPRFTGNASGLQIVFDAVSNTRELTKVDLLFAPAADSQLTATTVTFDLASASTQYFTSSAGVGAGGSFTITINLTFTGDPKALPSAVTVTLTNSRGSVTAPQANRQ